MPRIDDYYNAARIAIETLIERSPDRVVERSGYQGEKDHITVPFLNRTYHIHMPDYGFSDVSPDPTEVPVQEQVLILHYLQSESDRTPSDNWVAYREIPGASFYFSAFVKRAIDPLKKTFGQNIRALTKAAEKLSGRSIPAGDAGFEFRLFPRIPVQLILWEGDNEFPAEANILFDESIGDMLSSEDIAWLSGMLVYRLMALAR